MCLCIFFLPRERTAKVCHYSPLRKYPEILFPVCLEWLKCSSSLKNKAIKMPGGHYVRSSPVIPPKGLTWKEVFPDSQRSTDHLGLRDLSRVFSSWHIVIDCMVAAACTVLSASAPESPRGFGEFLWCHSQVEVSGSWGEIPAGIKRANNTEKLKRQMNGEGLRVCLRLLPTLLALFHPEKTCGREEGVIFPS